MTDDAERARLTRQLERETLLIHRVIIRQSVDRILTERAAARQKDKAS